MSAAVAYAPSIVNRGVHLHPLSLNYAPPKALVGASLKGYSLHCIIFGTATEADIGGGNMLKCMAYIMVKIYPEALPSEHYFNVILAGYTHNKINVKPLFEAHSRNDVG